MTLRPRVVFSGQRSKQGNAPEECEDALALSPSTGHFAIADGASDASYSGIWARILVDSFPELQPSSLDALAIDAWLDQSCRPKWSSWESSLTARPLPWFTREKLRLGSHATFLGMWFDRTSATTSTIFWQAVGYGDCCLFIVQDDYLRFAFPLDDPASFGNTPPLIPTVARSIGDLLRIIPGSASPADKIYLVTDALAEWFLRGDHECRQPWRLLDALESISDLEEFVAARLHDGAMRNDDVTLVKIEFVLSAEHDSLA